MTQYLSRRRTLLLLGLAPLATGAFLGLLGAFVLASAATSARGTGSSLTGGGSTGVTACGTTARDRGA